VGEGGEQIDVLTLIFPAFVPAAVASTVQSQPNIAHRLQAVVELKGPIFWKTESIRIDSSSESNRTDSNRELECTSNYTRPGGPGTPRQSKALLRHCFGYTMGLTFQNHSHM